MRVLVLVINFGNGNQAYCQRLIDTLCDIKGYAFSIRVFSDAPTTLDNCEEILITTRTGFNFIEGLYDYLSSVDLEQWDYVLFTENDNLFTQDNLDTFFKYKQADDFAIGFLRYSELDGVKYIIDMHDTFNVEEIRDGNFVRFDSCHQGSWFLPTRTVKRFLLNRPAPCQELVVNGKCIESGENKMSNFYYSDKFPGSRDGVKRYISLVDLEKLLVHHQSDKHIDHYCKSLPLRDLLRFRDKIIGEK